MKLHVIHHIVLNASTNANEHVRACGLSTLVWEWWESMSVWATNWVWMRASWDWCIVVLSVCAALERQNAREEIIVSLWPTFALIKTRFKEKSRDTENFISPCLQVMWWHVFPLLPQLSLDLYYTEDEIYELSYAREPKNCKAPVSDGSRYFQWTPV